VPPALESSAISGALEELLSAFEAYKEANDARLSEIEARGGADPLIDDKIARLDHALDELTAKSRRARRGEPLEAGDGQALAHKAAFQAYVRKGDAGKLAALEEKALSVGSEADGGYLVPDVTERAIMQALEDESPLRGIAGSLTISTSVYKRPFVVADAEAGWVGETAARPQTAAPTLVELAFPTMEVYAMPAATLRLLDDSAVDIESWIAADMRSAFARQESLAFVTGDGVNKPKGFLAYGAVPENAWAWGQLGYVATGVAAAFPTDNPADCLLELVFSLKGPYRRRARFVLNRMTQAAVRKLKNDDGDYLWQPTLGAALEPTLLGYPITDCEEMPDITGGSLALAFGDFKRGYLVVDRAGIHVLRDPFTAKPYVLFYTTKRVGGGVQDFNAIKLLKFAAS
jgi:HK97 family phage major capsid protein